VSQITETVCNDVTFHAEAAPDYVFDGWYDENDVLVSTDNPYTFTVTGNLTLTAKAVLTPSSEVIVRAEPGNGVYSVRVNDKQGAEYENVSDTVSMSSLVTVSAEVRCPYQWDGWYDNGTFVSSDNPYTFTATSNIDLKSKTTLDLGQDVKLWTEVVTENPGTNHFVVDGSGNVTIKSAKGLAYLISYVNGLNDCTDNPHNMSGNTVTIELDTVLMDLEMYDHMWVPIGFDEDTPFKGTFDGNYNGISGVHIDSKIGEVAYLEGKLGKTLKYSGLFGYTEGATIKNTIVHLGDGECKHTENDWMSIQADGGYIGLIVAYGKNLDMESCYAVQGLSVDPIGSETTIESVGGLVGHAEGNHSIKACWANANIIFGRNDKINNMGGIVGSIDNNYKVKNSFSMTVDVLVKYGYATGNTPDEVTNKGAIVGYSGNPSNVTNVYVHPYTTLGFDKVVGNETTASNWYSVDTNTYSITDTPDCEITTKFTSAKENRYGVQNNTVDVDGKATPLSEIMNKNMEEEEDMKGYRWITPPTTSVNAGYPLILNTTKPCMTLLAVDNPKEHISIQYVAGLKELYTVLTSMDDEDDGSKDDEESIGILMYTGGEIDESVIIPAEFPGFFIDENVAVTQGGDGEINATVGITLDNSAGNGEESRDWHMFASPLAAAQTGLVYNSQPTSYPTSENDLTFGEHYSLMQNNAAVYFPNGITAGNQFDLYSYCEPEYHWINLKRTNHWHQDSEEPISYTNETTYTPGKGYLVALGNNTTADNNFMQAKGVLNNGDVSATLTSEGEHLKGYNLLGNPYQSYLDFNKFAEVNGDHIWSSTSDTGYMSYLVYNADAGGFEEYLTDGYQSFSQGAAQTKSQYINMHQGFFVVKKNGTDGQVKFNNDMRVTEIPSDYTGAQPSFRNAHNYPLVNLFCTDSDGKREVSVIEVERPLNAGSLKMKGMLSGKGQMYLHWGSDDFGSVFIDHTPDYVPVWFEAVEDGVFTMSWNTANDDFGYLHLVDNLTGNDIDMLASDSYSFEAQVSDSKARFRLVFKPLGIEEETTEVGENFAFINGNELVVTGEGELSLIDLNGRVLATEYVSGQQSHITLPVVADGMYMLRLTKANDVRVQKIVIRK